MSEGQREGVWWPKAIRSFSPSSSSSSWLRQWTAREIQSVRPSVRLITGVLAPFGRGPHPFRRDCEPLKPEPRSIPPSRRPSIPFPFSPPCSFFFPSNHLVVAPSPRDYYIGLSLLPFTLVWRRRRRRRPHHLRKRSLNGPKWTTARAPPPPPSASGLRSALGP